VIDQLDLVSIWFAVATQRLGVAVSLGQREREQDDARLIFRLPDDETR